MFLEHNQERLKKAKGSATKHQAWEGGYIDHIYETMEIAMMLYNRLDGHLGRDLPFSLSDVMLTLFLHDLEKPWKHIGGGRKFTKTEAKKFRKQKIEEYGFRLTNEHWNALEYVEGEHDYHPIERKQGRLAAFIHCCDTLSARMWFDEPKKTGYHRENLERDPE